MTDEAPDEKWIWKLDRKIPSDPDMCAAIIAELLDALEANQWSDRDSFGIRMAMEEAIQNAIRHGNDCDPDKRVAITMLLSAKQFRATIADQGSGFDPLSLPDPCDDSNVENSSGRGVKLIRSFMSEIRYNATGNTLHVQKTRSPDSAAEAETAEAETAEAETAEAETAEAETADDNSTDPASESNPDGG